MGAPGQERRLLECLAGDERLDSRRIAIVVAHPDDETIGIGAQLPRMPEVTLVHVTDGAPLDPSDARRSGFAGAEAYAAARRSELEAAVALAGISRERLIGFGLRDQEAALHLPALTRRLAGLFRERGIDQVVTHAYEGGHPDHDAAAFGVHMASRLMDEPLTIVEIPLYRIEGGERVLQRFRADLERPEWAVWLDERQSGLKRAMLDAHRSQRTVTGPFRIDVERFRLAPSYDFTRLPNEGEILYDQFGWAMTGARWRELACQALGELGASR
jgi:LmbE family N-acetylglucosaminyl deacetylase